ncbi:MAG: SpoIIE family protein phosphatase [Porticoccaceae bacterium]|nr:SpoIIE family protein phosphatase [Pseudomonadales bacterium]MCP5171692.1 SpoIIE family protein phosphatase [Pseudomonadales bacterium]
MNSPRRLFIVGQNSELYQQWSEYLSGTDWAVEIFTDYDDVKDTLLGNIDSSALVLLDMSLSEVRDFKFLGGVGSTNAFIVVLENPTATEVATCYRNDATDILIKPFDQKELLKSLERSAKYQKLLVENQGYREQLEAANRNLQDSLRILEMDQIAGRQVQQSMLPVTPQRFGDYEISHFIVPSLYLSGDFVGYHCIFDRYLVFYAADVSGHGASSAFLTVLLRFLLTRILRRHVHNDDRDAMARAPQGFVEYINRQILAIGLDKHLTMFAGSIDMEQNTLRYAVGAHMPMPVLVHDGEVEMMEGKGKPLGIFEDVHWSISEKALPDKFALVLTSDGVLEVLPGESMEDKEQFMLSAIASSDTSLDSICQQLGLRDLTESPDDVTVLTVRRGY